MKRTIFYLILTALITVSCQSNKGGGNSHDGYVINGTIQNAGNNQVLLQHLTLGQARTIDTTSVDKKGNFTLKGYLNEDGVYMLRLSNQKRWAIYLNQGDQINFTVNGQNPLNYSVSGSQAAERFVSFMKTINQKQQAVQQKRQEFSQARAQRKGAQALTKLRQEYAKSVQDVQNYVKTFADTSSNLIMSAFAANMLNTDQHFEFMSSIADKLKSNLPNSVYTKQFTQKIDKKAALTKGNDAPDIEMKNPQGQKMSLDDVQGKVVLVDFWASWCKPCRVENPNLVKTYKKYKDDGFTIFSVSLDKNMKKWKQAIKQDNLTWNYHVSDLKGWRNQAAQKYQVNSIPATFLLDRDGEIIAKNLRGNKLEQKLAEVFGEDQKSS